MQCFRPDQVNEVNLYNFSNPHPKIVCILPTYKLLPQGDPLKNTIWQLLES